MYAYKITKSIQNTINTTNIKREKQIKYNQENNITPTQINKKKENSIISTLNPYKIKLDNNEEILNIKKIPKQEISQLIKETKNEMQRMAKSLNFIEAAKLRDKLFKLKEILK